MNSYIGQKLSKKPTSSVRFGKIHNFSFPAVAMKQRRKRIYLKITKIYLRIKRIYLWIKRIYLKIKVIRLRMKLIYLRRKRKYG